MAVPSLKRLVLFRIGVWEKKHCICIRDPNERAGCQTDYQELGRSTR